MYTLSGELAVVVAETAPRTAEVGPADRCGSVVFRMTPFEWESQRPTKPGDDTLENSMTLLNCLWFSIGSVLCAGCEILPK